MDERATGAVDRGGRLPGQAVWFDGDRLLARLPAGGENQAMPEGVADLPSPSLPSSPRPARWTRMPMYSCSKSSSPFLRPRRPAGAFACGRHSTPIRGNRTSCRGRGRLRAAIPWRPRRCRTLTVPAGTLRGPGATLCWADRGLVVHRRGPQLPGEPAGAAAVPRALPSRPQRMAAPCRERSGPAKGKAIPCAESGP